MERLRQQLIGTVSRILGRQEAEDIAQEAVCRLIDTRRNGRAIGNESAYARQTAVRLAIDHIRRRNGWAANLQNAAATRPQAPEVLATPEDVERLYEAIGELPSRQAAVVTLRKLLELEYAEVAALLGISEANCRSHCRHGMHRLRRALGGTQDNDAN